MEGGEKGDSGSAPAVPPEEASKEDEQLQSGAPSSEAPRTAVESGYSYAQFVERFKHPSAQSVVNKVRDFVNQFPVNLTRPQAARRIHNFLAEVTPLLLAAEAFGTPEVASADAQELAGEGLEKFVVLKLYKLLFRHAPADQREDERVEAALQAARPAKGPHAALLIAANQLDARHKEVFEGAAEELKKVDQYRAPRDKSSCFVNAVRLVESIVVERVFQRGGSDGHSDGNFAEKLLMALLVLASPPNLYSNIEFTAAFRHPSRMTSDDRKCLSDLAVAMLAVTGSGLRLSAADLAEKKEAQAAAALGSVSGAGASAEDMPLWLLDAGVTFHFENRSADDLLVGEMDELLDEYHKMARALRELVESSGNPAEA